MDAAPRSVQEGLWQQPWLRACAIYGAGQWHIQEVSGDIESVLDVGEPASETTWPAGNAVLRERPGYVKNRV